MSRFSRYDSDEERLPEGMTRIGYDADAETYTFRDADGSIWESAPGSRYGQLTRVSGGTAGSAGSDDGRYDSEDGDREAQTFLEHESARDPTSTWRHDLRPLFNFGMLLCLCLLGLFWYLRRASPSPDGKPDLEVCPGDGSVGHAVKKGDTCWSLGEAVGISVENLLQMNPSIDCDNLPIGSVVCVPSS